MSKLHAFLFKVISLCIFLGQASSNKAEQAGKLAENMADLAWTFASREGFRVFKKQNTSLLENSGDISSHTKRHYSTTSSSKGNDFLVCFVFLGYDVF